MHLPSRRHPNHRKPTRRPQPRPNFIPGIAPRSGPSLSFQGSYHPGSRHLQGKESVQFTRINAGQQAYTLILAIVPPCAGECRLVRVTGVLIFANARTCVAFVLLATDPLNQRADAASGPLPDPAALLRASRRAAAATHRPADRSVPSWRYVGNDVPLRTGCAPADSNHAERLIGAAGGWV